MGELVPLLETLGRRADLGTRWATPRRRGSSLPCLAAQPGP